MAQSVYSFDPYAEDASLQPAQTPIWREAMFPLDWMALRTSPVYYGCNVPHGNGEPVVVVPGFLASDVSLSELYLWLARIGYRPYFSDVGRNADCPDHIASRLMDTVRRAKRETGQRVRLVGHSLGGMLSRSVALDNPEDVSLVISMGSPFKDAVRAHPTLMAAVSALRSDLGRHVARNVKPACFSGHCMCPFVKNMLAPSDYEVAHYAIYSRNDGVVEWESCIEDDPDLNDEVNCTHIGMAFHPGVYRVIAQRLRQAPAY
ncbi:MAG TPA: alpha/beta hydrolase-fold protein [Tepidiformaceae bacterium]|nr:alpha/beta hydrolase-fold protein [Tepidiformaceae bacterium]